MMTSAISPYHNSSISVFGESHKIGSIITTPLSYASESYIDLEWSIKAELVKAYEIDAQKILTRYPGGLSLAREGNIDLSHLGLKHLPPHILMGCSNAKTLNLKGNDLHWLPEELKNLGLEKLDISGNKRLQPNLGKFSWLSEMSGLYLVANDMGFDFTPRGWNGRFESNDIQYEDAWMTYQTQELEDEFNH